jgi:diguanylate cyclase (GGDEF)-like protein
VPWLQGSKTLDEVWHALLGQLAPVASLQSVALFDVRPLPDEAGQNGFCPLYHEAQQPGVQLVRRWTAATHMAAASATNVPAPELSFAKRQHPFILAAQGQDTRYCQDAEALGAAWCQQLGLAGLASFHLFVLPLVSPDDNRTLALLTLGYTTLGTAEREQVAWLYQQRPALAQRLWTLQLQARLEAVSQVDSLTGLLTHSGFQQALTLEVQQYTQHTRPFSLLLVDISQFHAINLAEGHAVGDALLCHLAQTLRRQCRGVDTLARYGPDDLAVLLPGLDAAQTETLTRRLCHAFETDCPEGLPAAVLRRTRLNMASLSVPWDTIRLGEPQLKRETLLMRLEQALYVAQHRTKQADTSQYVTGRELANIQEHNWLEIYTLHMARRASQFAQPSVYQHFLRMMEMEGGRDLAPIPAGAPPNVMPLSSDTLMLETIRSLAGALEAKDRYTRGHSQMVANYALILSQGIGLSEEECEDVRLAAFLHDIGKIGIPEAILCKAGPLDEEEWTVMRQHPVIGARQILGPMSAFQQMIPMVAHHHERWDGTGYPDGLRGEGIPIGARIVAIVDAFHGLTSDRSYRKASSLSEAIAILEPDAGRLWDAKLLQQFFEIIRKASLRPATWAL